MKETRQANKIVNFYSPEGSLIAKSTKVHHLLHIPYFVMKIDNITEYNIMSEKSFSLRNQKFTLNPDEKMVYDNCKEIGMRDNKALAISRFLSSFEKEIAAKTEWNQNELLIVHYLIVYVDHRLFVMFWLRRQVQIKKKEKY